MQIKQYINNIARVNMVLNTIKFDNITNTNANGAKEN